MSDLHEENRLGNELFHGGLGLFTYNGIKKPVYHAFYLLNKLGDTLLSKGDGYFVTKSRKGIQVFLYNYQHYSSIYAAGETFDMTFLDRYTPFDNIKKEFNLLLSPLDNAEYCIKEYSVNRIYGSSFDKWVEMGGLPLANNEELELLKSLSSPMLNKYCVSVNDNLFSFLATLEALEIRLIEIEKLIS